MDREVFLSRAQSLREQGAYESALEPVKYWLEQNPGDIDALIVQCCACMRLGRLEEATAVIEDVEMTVLGLSRIYACMGDICFNGGLNQEAVKFYNRFMALNPSSDLSLKIIKKLRILEENQEDLIKRENDQETLHPSPTVIGFKTLTMVDLYIQQGHLDEAEATLKEMLIRTPNDTELHEKLAGVRSLMEGQTLKAIKLQRREIVIDKLNRWLGHLQKRKLICDLR
jgi:tetratricopeptide (TPR) repeat protein